MRWTVNIHVSVRGTGGHSMECPTIPWNVPQSHGTVGGMDSRTHESVEEEQVNIPWKVPWDVGWDGHFPAFLDSPRGAS